MVRRGDVGVHFCSRFPLFSPSCCIVVLRCYWSRVRFCMVYFLLLNSTKDILSTGIRTRKADTPFTSCVCSLVLIPILDTTVTFLCSGSLDKSCLCVSLPRLSSTENTTSNFLSFRTTVVICSEVLPRCVALSMALSLICLCN